MLLFALIALAGCSQNIVGETNKPPPKGGPHGSNRHPPGESVSVVNHDAGK